MFSVKQVYDLQELDWKMAAIDQSLSDVRTKLSDDSALVTLRKRIEETEAKLTTQSAARRRVESEVERLNERLRAAERRLYGGAVTNPRELSASEEERGAVLEQRAAEEDKLLELMVDVEELQATRDESQDQLSSLEAQRAAEYPNLVKDEERLAEELDEVRLERMSVAPEIPAAVLSTYESLRKSRDGHAVARVERGMCQGCRLALPESERQRARSSQTIVQCSSCRRILYVA